MLSEPAPDHGQIRDAVSRLWGRQVASLRFLTPGGECSWGYRLVTVTGERYFLKLTQPRVCGTTLCEQNLVAADELARALGRERIVSALPARSGRFLETVGPCQALLLPWVAGRALMDLRGGPDAAQQRRLGELVAQIHAYTPQQRPLPESFARAELRDWPRLQAAVNAPPRTWCRQQRALAQLIRAAQPRMARWRAVCQALERRVRAARHRPVFCHGDPSGGNVLLRANGQLALIDLDAPAWAPRERDLFHLRLWPAALAGYHQRFPGFAPDADLLRLYQLAWDFGEVVDFGWRALMTRQSAAQIGHDLRALRAHLAEAA